MPVKKAHITLLVFHVPTERLEEAKEIFRNTINESIVNHLDGADIFDVTFEGVGSFGGRVVYAEPQNNVHRMKFLNEVFFRAFSEKGFIADSKFTPHLTLLKKGYRSRTNLSKIPPEAYEAITDKYFGVQEFSGIQFLSMAKPQTKEGYYFCEEKFEFKPKGRLQRTLKELSRRREKIRRLTRNSVIRTLTESNKGLVVTGLVIGAAFLWAKRHKFLK